MPRLFDDEILLITGFPGFRARSLVEFLSLAAPGARLELLVHPRRRDEAASLAAALGAVERVSFLEGDPGAIDFGLTRAEYRELAQRVQRVFSLHQVTDAALDRETAREANVKATRELIEFGKVSRRLRCLVHFSSTFVSGNRTGLVLEDELDAGQSFRNPVEETLALSELMLRRVMHELPIVILRPSQIVGDSRTGEIERLDGVYPLVVLLVSAPADLQLPLPPRAEAALHIVPVDFVMRAASALAARPEALGRTFHLSDPSPPSIRRFFELLATECGKRLATGFHPGALSKLLLNNPGVRLVTRSPRALLDLLSMQVSYDTRRAQAILEREGIECPRIDAYVRALVGHVEERIASGNLARKKDGDVHELIA
jgi:thioester reductase-like protein